MPKYDFKRRNSSKPLFSVNAVSVAQAIFKGRKKHPSMEYLDDHIERGLITVSVEDPLILPPEADARDDRPICPNCGSHNVKPGQVAGELQCIDCGWLWDSDIEEAIDALLRRRP